MSSTSETLQETVSQITDDNTDNRGGNNKNGGNNIGGKNVQNGNGGGNNISNRNNFGGSARSRGPFPYMTTDRVAATKVHDIKNVPDPTKNDTMAQTES